MKILMLFISFVFAQSGFAESPQIHIWQNETGLQNADHCGVLQNLKSDFQIVIGGKNVEHSALLHNDAGEVTGEVPSGSIIATEGPSKNNLVPVKIISIPSDIHQSNSTVALRQRGWIKKINLSDINQFRFRIEMNKETHHLAPAIHHGTPLHLKCTPNDGTDTYQLFQIIHDSASQNLRLIGVNPQNTDFISKLEVTPSTHEQRQVWQETLAMHYEDLLLETEPTSHPVEEDETLENPPSIDEEDTPPEGVLVVCTGGGNLNIRDDSLEQVVFKSALGERVNLFQSWEGEDTQTKEIGGVVYTFVKLQFPDREEPLASIGWAADKFIKSRSECPSLPPEEEVPDGDWDITDLDDPRCCEFPTIERPTHSFTSSPRKFRARRSGGRKHAACDLYRVEDEPVVSIAPGTVIRGKYYFYQGTYAIEVQHGGGSVARYGEITGDLPEGIEKDARITKGQRIGYIGKVNSNCCNPMLHFELYSGELDGPLSQKGNEYKRRDDLMNPTDYLKDWLEKTR